MAEKRVIEIQVKTNATQASAEISGVAVSSTAAAAGVTTLGNASAATSAKMGTFGAIKTAITGLVPGLKGAESGVMGLGAQFTKLLANPIVLLIAGIVASLKLVYEAFQSNVQGGKQIAQVWAGLSAVGTQVKDATMGLVRAFGYAVQAAYKFLTLDFKGASEAIKNANEEATDSFKQLGDAASGKTFKIVRALEKEQQANNKAKKEQTVAQSEVNKLLVQSREILTDETTSMNEKRKALAQVTREENKAAAERTRIAAKDLEILKTRAKALGGQAEIKMKQEIREATIALNEAETEGAMTGIKLNRQKKMLARQETAENKEAINAAKERGKENAEKEKERVKQKEDALKKIKELETAYSDSLLSDEAREIVGVQRKYKEIYDEAVKHNLDITELKKAETAEKLKIELKYDEELKLKTISPKDAIKGLVDSSKTRLQIEKETSEKSIQIAKEEAEKKAAILQKQLDLVKGTFQAFADVATLFAGKNKKAQKTAFNIQKAANIASATIDTYTAATAAFKSAAGIPVVGPVLAPIAAAGAVAAGLMNIKKIAASQFEGASAPSGGGGGGGSGGGATAPTMSAPQFNVVGQSGVNQLASLNQQPIQAYVVSGQVTSQQALDRNRLANATFGG
jgi:hypothetical protein